MILLSMAHLFNSLCWISKLSSEAKVDREQKINRIAATPKCILLCCRTVKLKTQTQWNYRNFSGFCIKSTISFHRLNEIKLYVNQRICWHLDCAFWDWFHFYALLPSTYNNSIWLIQMSNLYYFYFHEHYIDKWPITRLHAIYGGWKWIIFTEYY